MLEIAGGTYLEHCEEPYWDQLFGSGGRAAAALAGLSEQVRLWTYIGPEHQELLDALAASFGFEVHHINVAETVSFKYDHPLSTPVVLPLFPQIKQAPPQKIEAGNILRFGMLEGDAEVHGDRVVYDPQSVFDPKPFDANGSTAEHLAVVLNYAEARALALASQSGARSGRSTTVVRVAQAVLRSHEAEVVVIKQGAAGATVVTSASTSFISALKTDRVWPIGSGDVFAAVFAHFWAEEGREAADSARIAALATAYYCNFRVLPIPTSLDDFHPPAVEPRRRRATGGALRVYLAGPFFTMAQRWIINEARASLLGQGLQVFSPLHDVGHGVASLVVPADIEALEQSDVVFAIADGTDAGTLFEIGYARARGVPVIAFVQNEPENELKMLQGTNCLIYDDFASAIYHTAWTARER